MWTIVWLGVLVWSSVALALPPCYTVTTIDVPAPDGTIGNTALADIDNTRVTIGNYTNLQPPEAYRRRPHGGLRRELRRWGNAIVFLGSNDRGNFVGWMASGKVPQRGIFVTGGKYLQHSVPGALWTMAQGVNNRGQVVGTFRDGASGQHRGYRWDATTRQFTLVVVPFAGVELTELTGINNQDDPEIVGSYLDATGWHGLHIVDGTFAPFDVPGADATFIADINDRGDFVGDYLQGGTSYGFVYRQGEIHTLTFPDIAADAVEVGGMNNRGHIVGRYFVAATGLSHGFLASPIAGCRPPVNVAGAGQ